MFILYVNVNQIARNICFPWRKVNFPLVPLERYAYATRFVTKKDLNKHFDYFSD